MFSTTVDGKSAIVGVVFAYANTGLHNGCARNRPVNANTTRVFLHDIVFGVGSSFSLDWGLSFVLSPIAGVGCYPAACYII
jgi:hypothetical protein